VEFSDISSQGNLLLLVFATIIHTFVPYHTVLYGDLIGPNSSITASACASLPQLFYALLILDVYNLH